MNPTTCRSPGRVAARALAAMSLAAASFLAPTGAHAADEAGTGLDSATETAAAEEVAHEASDASNTQADNAATTDAATTVTSDAATDNAATTVTTDAAADNAATTVTTDAAADNAATTVTTDAAADNAEAAATNSIALESVATDAATASGTGGVTTCDVMRTPPDGTTATLNRGHADIFDLTSDAAGALTLRIKEDATGSGVLREPEQTLLAIPASTLTQIPDAVSQTTGAPAAAYLLGQSGDNQATVLWPGWDTLGIAAGGYDAARFHITYSGPADGRIYAFTSSFAEGLKAVTADGSYDLAPGGDDIDQPYAAHKHVNWLFTRAGRYTLTVQASAWTPGNTGTANAVAPTRTYTIDVADEASCLAESGSAPSTDQAQPAPAPGVGPGSVSSNNNQATQNRGDNGATETPSAPAPATNSGTTGTTGTTTGANPAPSSGARTTSGTTGGERCVATRITREATEAEAATLASNSAPANTARTTLTVSVGDGASGNATDGHFDLGPAIENGTLVARVKDDRSQPAQWVDPSSLTFALGDAARITAPADLGFVATAGSSVWLIPSTQIAGVPWLGLNSQREEIVTGTTGGVQFTLDAVEGPGRVAVFNAGALGSGVGEHVFDGPGSSYTLGPNTHAHQNWVFTAPGTYTLTISMRVTPTGAALTGSGYGSSGEVTATGALGTSSRPMASQVVGRTASGKDCDLSLAITGADTIPLAVVSLTWALTGAACVWVSSIGRRRNARAFS